MAMHKSRTERFLPDDDPGAMELGLSLPQQAPINDAPAEQKQKVTLETMQEIKGTCESKNDREQKYSKYTDKRT
ncbi:unnamed protein product [Pseudo-nitzschia multistriata]|uniref:Uncharacterized protein n=1 Tax=Pseudo-nitzschia multistriata TaxID=183589 RepID=A0A448YZK0_9STRA|nr:unnamed protein product [Pseudo-nitzschia multistriata]